MIEKLTKIPWAAQDELYAELSKVSNVAGMTPASPVEKQLIRLIPAPGNQQPDPT